jgi:hypothetical protein
MITIFSDFRQFSAKLFAFFSKTNVMIKFYKKVTVVWAKNAKIFAKCLGENIFFYRNIGPRSPCLFSTPSQPLATKESLSLVARFR